ncbi:hypothetical protein BJY24_004447 [Nocardia transvalensis]|uniref:Uncharacterized protein n=1 Tax=Nocardia transvalensis TaxID=37333 RepID=A0A7W9PGL7_9NOCA|nr:hypothetical protein [Nocardia transvalensis]MBB5915535.1 hypothetical protein [Nocardia transvalensis]
MPITDYMFPHDPDRERAAWMERRARRAGYRMDRSIAGTGGDGYRLCDAETGYEYIRSRTLDAIEEYLNS